MRLRSNDQMFYHYPAYCEPPPLRPWEYIRFLLPPVKVKAVWSMCRRRANDSKMLAGGGGERRGHRRIEQLDIRGLMTPRVALGLPTLAQWSAPVGRLWLTAPCLFLLHHHSAHEACIGLITAFFKVYSPHAVTPISNTLNKQEPRNIFSGEGFA